MILTPLQKLPNNVDDLGKIIVATESLLGDVACKTIQLFPEKALASDPRNVTWPNQLDSWKRSWLRPSSSN